MFAHSFDFAIKIFSTTLKASLIGLKPASELINLWFKTFQGKKDTEIKRESQIWPECVISQFTGSPLVLYTVYVCS